MHDKFLHTVTFKLQGFGSEPKTRQSELSTKEH